MEHGSARGPRGTRGAPQWQHARPDPWPRPVTTTSHQQAASQTPSPLLTPQHRVQSPASGRAAGAQQLSGAGLAQAL